MTACFCSSIVLKITKEKAAAVFSGKIQRLNVMCHEGDGNEGSIYNMVLRHGVQRPRKKELRRRTPSAGFVMAAT